MMAKAHPKVSIAILNWNGLEDTLVCLKQVRKLDYPDFEIIVVDNGSKDGSKEHLTAEDDVLLISLPENTGFTGGHIAAAEVAKGDYILLLNNDLAIDSQWINRALETFQKHEKVAAVGGKQYKWNDKNPVFNRANEYYAFQEVNPVTGNTYTLLVGEEERPVDSISGAALIVKRSVIDKLGYLDNDFFAYYEETDMIARFWRAGFETYYNPKCEAWHKVAAASAGGAEGSFYLYMMHRNRFQFAAKNFDADFYKRFMAGWRREAVCMAVRYLLRRDLESKMRLKAFASSLIHRPKIIKKRHQVLALGHSYIDKLSSYRPSDVTIVIPCYNYANYVAEAIDSALAQSLRPKKIIIINDGSTDNSQKVIDGYKNNPFIEIIHKKNEGVVTAKNLGASLSKTYWTVFLDADDIIEPDYVKKLVNLANASRYDVAYTDMEYFGAVSDIFRSRPFSIFPMLSRNFVHNSALIKTSRLRQVGGYKPQMSDGLEDWELYLSLFEIGASFGYLPEAIFKYRQHEGTLSRNIDVQKNKELELYNRLRDLHPSLFRHMNPGRRRALRALNLLYLFVRYPYLFVVVIKSLPHAAKSGVRTSLHEVRAYLHKKTL